MDSIPLKLKTSNATFVDQPIAPAKPPTPPLVKISEIDLVSFFEKEDFLLSEVDSIMALKMLDYLITHLIKIAEKSEEEEEEVEQEEEEVEEDEEMEDTVGFIPTRRIVSLDEESDYQDTPISPKKRRFSDMTHNYVLRSIEDNSKAFTPSKTQQSSLVKRFLLKELPELSSTQYLERINRYCGLSAAVYLTCTFYLYKLVVQWEVLTLTKYNVHRLIIAGLRVSCKTTEDVNHRQQFIAKIGGVHLDDLKLLEISFLFLLSFDCQCSASSLKSLLENVGNIFRSELV
jgi:hypothetical protein